MTSNDDALRIVRLASAGGYFDDLAEGRSNRKRTEVAIEVRRRITDLIGETKGREVGFYPRGNGARPGDLFGFYPARPDINEEIDIVR